MGSPVSVVVAEIVMQHVEERALATCRQTIPLWLRYVDEIFTAVHKDEIDAFHDHLNKPKKSKKMENFGSFSRLFGTENQDIPKDYSTNHPTTRPHTKPLPAPYKRLIHDVNKTDKRTSNRPN